MGFLCVFLPKETSEKCVGSSALPNGEPEGPFLQGPPLSSFCKSHAKILLCVQGKAKMV